MLVKRDKIFDILDCRITVHHQRMPGQKLKAGIGKRKPMLPRSWRSAAYWLSSYSLLSLLFIPFRTRGWGGAQPLSWAELSHISHQIRKCPTIQFSLVGAFAQLSFPFCELLSLVWSWQKTKTNRLHLSKALLVNTRTKGCVYVWIIHYLFKYNVQSSFKHLNV